MGAGLLHRLLRKGKGRMPKWDLVREILSGGQRADVGWKRGRRTEGGEAVRSLDSN